ncbi:MAG TPA: hypothetical protein VH593_07855 [Ktedonobacteraceae bacterium]
MNLYLVSRTDTPGEDQYDAILVAAKDSTQARNVHPQANDDYSDYGRTNPFTYGVDWWSDEDNKVWRQHPKDLKCEYIGMARPSYKEPTVIIASFNAG